MIRPVRSHDALLADIRASDKRDGSFRLWWLGQSGFLLQWQGVHVCSIPIFPIRSPRNTARPINLMSG